MNERLAEWMQSMQLLLGGHWPLHTAPHYMPCIVLSTAHTPAQPTHFPPHLLLSPLPVTPPHTPHAHTLSCELLSPRLFPPHTHLVLPSLCSWDFRQEERLGCGHFSEVSAVVHRLSGKRYALKRSKYPLVSLAEKNQWLGVSDGMTPWMRVCVWGGRG
jgi:hypothetical protein